MVVSIDVNDDDDPAWTQRVTLSSPTGEVNVHVPSSMGAPDVAHADFVAATGIESEISSVLIQR